MESECSRKAEIDAPEVVSDKRIAGIDPDAIVISEDVAVGVKPREFGEALRRLDGGYQAEEKVAREDIPGGGRRHGAVQHQAVADVVGRKGALGAEVFAVLRDQHETGVRPVIDGLRPGVADAIREIPGQPFVNVDQ